MEKRERIEKFLKELSCLSKKYDLVIGGCGCCGSPYVDDRVTHENVMEYLKFDDEKIEYSGDVVEKRVVPIIHSEETKTISSIMTRVLKDEKDEVAEKMLKYLEEG